ncbi:MerR family transcriptional regulator [Streptomyces sp. NPDC021212]|uniref:MerR family transcriptional regulator n=1 Tax=Streptomyces sp. NPDC021212 TaxID=3365118 RepID=UPI00379EB28A
MTVMEQDLERAPALARPRACVGRRPHPRPTGQDRYTISEVAAHTGLTAHTLRWYERIGLMPHVDRTHTGQRRFTNRDLDWLDLVGKLRLTGMPVADMVRYAELVREGEQTFAAREELLTEHRANVLERIAELESTLDVLDYKIGIYAEARRAQ